MTINAFFNFWANGNQSLCFVSLNTIHFLSNQNWANHQAFVEESKDGVGVFVEYTDLTRWGILSVYLVFQASEELWKVVSQTLWGV